MKRLALIMICGVGCNWMEFDDLADTTWVHAQGKPGDVGASDYGVAIANAGDTTTMNAGGKLAVLSNDSPNYSTLAYDASGGVRLGPNPQGLGNHFITSLGQAPILVSDATGKIAIVAPAIDAGNIAVVLGPPDTPADMPFQSMDAPDAAVFSGTTLIVAAGPNLFVLDGMTAARKCVANDVQGQPLTTAALGAGDDPNKVYVWTKTGKFFAYDKAQLLACTTTPVTPIGALEFASGFMPGPGARVHFVPGTTFAILIGRVANMSAGSAFVVQTTTLSQVGTTQDVAGMRSSVVGKFGDPGAEKTYLVVGYPDRTVEAVVAGQVQFYEIDAAGAITLSMLLSDAEPENTQLFGRGLAVLRYNNKDILAVAASNEIFTYFRTTLYAETRAR